MARQGYQNIINVHNEDSESQTTSGSSFTNPLSNLGVNLNEEQFQYSSYYNTYMNKRRSRNSSIIMAIIGVFIFFGFIDFVTTPHGHTSKAQQSESAEAEEETIVSPPTSEKTISDLENIPTNPPTSTQDIFQVSKEAYDRFRGETVKTDGKVKPGCEATILIVPPCEQDLIFTNNKYVNEHCNYVGFERAQYLSVLFGDIVLSPDRRRRRRSLQTETNDENTEGQNDSTNNSTIIPEDMTAEEFLETAEIAEEAAAVESAFIINEYLPIKWPTPSFLYALSPFQRSSSSSNDKALNYRELETISPLAEKYSMEIHNKYVETKDDMEKLSSELFQKLTSGDMCGKTAVIVWSHGFIPQLAQTLGCGPLQGCPLTYDILEYDEVWSLKYVYEPNVSNLLKGEEVKKDDMTAVKGLWEMYGTRVKQDFDPLRFSAVFNDYNLDGVESGGKWNPPKEEL